MAAVSDQSPATVPSESPAPEGVNSGSHPESGSPAVVAVVVAPALEPVDDAGLTGAHRSGSATGQASGAEIGTSEPGTDADDGGASVTSGERLRVTLESLTAQDYNNLSILVIGYGPHAGDLAAHVAAAAPDSFFRRSQARGFAAAADEALELVTGGSFLLFCDTNVALDPGCVRFLVEEVFRSNAGVVTPKYLDFDDPRRIDAVGLGADQFGVTSALVERGDFDQEQYDHVSDVFVAPQGVQMVRADLYQALGGFDPVMGSANTDVDFCWRTHIVGARVMSVPSATVRRRHRELGRDRDQRRALERHRIRTLLVTLSPLSLLWTLPLALTQVFLAGCYGVFAGRPSQFGDVFDAIVWNVGELPDTRRRRAKLQALRKVPDREVRALQLGGSARFRGFLRGQVSAGDRVVGLASTMRGQYSGTDSATYRDATFIGVAVFILLVIGSRGLISDGVTPIGQFLDLPGFSDLWGEWWGGWRNAGVGGPGNPASAFGVLAVLRALFFWADGLPTLLLTLIPLLAGPAGMWRLVQPLGSLRAAAAAAVAYAANPLLSAIVTAGRWDALVLWGTMPWLVHSLLLLQAAPPFTNRGGVERSLPTRLLRTGLIVAAAFTFVPAIIPLALFLLLALLFGNWLAGQSGGAGALLRGLPALIVIPAALHAPYTVDILRRFSWSWIVGPPSPETSFDSLADLVRFAPGVGGIRFLALGLIVAASIPLAIGRESRFRLGTVGWSLATLAWLVAWASRRDWISVALPTAEIWLVVAATGIALAIGAGTASVEQDLAATRFGWRQGLAVGGTVLLGVSAGILLVGSTVSGRWGLPNRSHGDSVALATETYQGPSRVLWLGQPSVLPLDSLETERGVPYAVSTGRADARGRWVPGSYGINDQVGDAIDLVAAGDTSNGGALLAPYGIDLIVVVPTVAPSPYVGTPVDPGGGVVTALSSQLDLSRVPGMPDLIVYRNTRSQGPVVALEPGALAGTGGPLAAVNTDLTTGIRVDAIRGPSGHWSGPRLEQSITASEILVAVPAEGWISTTPSLGPRIGLGELLVARVDADGTFDVEYQTPVRRRLALIGQVLLVAAGLAVAQVSGARGSVPANDRRGRPRTDDAGAGQ